MLCFLRGATYAVQSQWCDLCCAKCGVQSIWRTTFYGVSTQTARNMREDNIVEYLYCNLCG
eukprot:4553640-Pyramimonas_sp.AAC.1